ncbi:uncharacterized protein LOC127720845 [Mytilus californianus]|uniref:uncharacterized protein LOC127720845 n=1 Tax=Mytilus californianus TaxID=6549 RepID=UPI00224512E7|nr:uncharacterized protein LOC127720845 [Mytilus californianus]
MPRLEKGVIKSEYGVVNIYINNPKEDIVSHDIYNKNVWEPWGINTVYKFIRHDPSIGVIDIGANIGVIALQLANVGRKVIAIEPTPQNTHNDHQDVPFAFPSKGEYALGFVDQGKDNISVKVNGVFIEWYYHRNTTSGKFLLQKFQEFDFEPFFCSDVLQDVSSNLDTPCGKIDVKRSGSWGTDVVWLPRGKKI